MAESAMWKMFVGGRWVGLPAQGCEFAVLRRGRLRAARAAGVRRALRRLAARLPSRARPGPALPYRYQQRSTSKQGHRRNAERSLEPRRRGSPTPVDHSSSDECLPTTVTTTATIHTPANPEPNSPRNSTKPEIQENFKRKRQISSSDECRVTELRSPKKSLTLQRKPAKKQRTTSTEPSPILKSTTSVKSRNLTRYLQPRNVKKHVDRNVSQWQQRNVSLIISSDDSDFEMDTSSRVKALRHSPRTKPRTDSASRLNVQKPTPTQTSNRIGSQVESQHTTSLLRELVIEETDVELLRLYIQKNYPDEDLLKFDEDDDYKRMHFYQINPLVVVERCPRIARMLRGSQLAESSQPRQLSVVDFASKLGLRSISDVSDKRRRYVTRSEWKIVGQRDSGGDTEDKENFVKPIKISRSIRSDDVLKEFVEEQNKKEIIHVDKAREVMRIDDEKSKEVKRMRIDDEKSKEVKRMVDEEQKELKRRADEKIKKVKRRADEKEKYEKRMADEKRKKFMRMADEKRKEFKRMADEKRKGMADERKEFKRMADEKRKGIADEKRKEFMRMADEKRKEFKRMADEKRKEVQRTVDEGRGVNTAQPNDEITISSEKDLSAEPKGPQKATVEAKLKLLQKTTKVIVSNRAVGAGAGKEYSNLEDHAIVSWVSSGGRASRVNGNQLWRELQDQYRAITGRERTWHSLRNRYLRYILPALGALALPPPQQARLRAAAATGELKARQRAPRRNSMFPHPPRGAASRLPAAPPRTADDGDAPPPPRAVETGPAQVTERADEPTELTPRGKPSGSPTDRNGHKSPTKQSTKLNGRNSMSEDEIESDESTRQTRRKSIRWRSPIDPQSTGNNGSESKRPITRNSPRKAIRRKSSSDPSEDPDMRSPSRKLSRRHSQTEIDARRSTRRNSPETITLDATSDDSSDVFTKRSTRQRSSIETNRRRSNRHKPPTTRSPKRNSNERHSSSEPTWHKSTSGDSDESSSSRRSSIERHKRVNSDRSHRLSGSSSSDSIQKTTKHNSQMNPRERRKRVIATKRSTTQPNGHVATSRDWTVEETGSLRRKSNGRHSRREKSSGDTSSDSTTSDISPADTGTVTGRRRSSRHNPPAEVNDTSRKSPRKASLRRSRSESRELATRPVATRSVATRPVATPERAERTRRQSQAHGLARMRRLYNHKALL